MCIMYPTRMIASPYVFCATCIDSVLYYYCAMLGGRSKAQSPPPSKSPRSPGSMGAPGGSKTTKSPESGKQHGKLSPVAIKSDSQTTPLSHLVQGTNFSHDAGRKEKKDKGKEKASVEKSAKDSVAVTPRRKDSGESHSTPVKQLKVEIAKKLVISAGGGILSSTKQPVKPSVSESKNVSRDAASSHSTKKKEHSQPPTSASK